MKICPPKESIAKRTFISIEEADEVSDIFEILSNSTRLRILHALVLHQELNVTQLSEITEMKAQAISNQLRRMSDKGVVESRREGNQILYSITMQCYIDLLEKGLCIAEEN